MRKTDFPNLFEVNYVGFIRGLRFFPKYIQKRITNRVFKSLQKLVSVNFNIVWSFDNSVFFRFDALPEGVLCISHIVDLNQDFEFEVASETSDFCFGTTSQIVAKQLKYNDDSYLLTHGVMLPEKAPEPVQLPGFNKLKAMYIGNLSMPYIDWKIIHSVVKKKSECDFVFVGSNGDNFTEKRNPYHKFKKQVYQSKNTYFLPRIASSDIPNYLQSADVLFLAYQEKYHLDQANPHKVMEYLLSAKPIILTYTVEYVGISNHLFMSKSNEEWADLWDDLQSKVSKWDKENTGALTSAYAKSNSYSNQLLKIEQAISR
ncbi:MAG: glycosyltransferase [Marinoscillum sp.]